LDKSTQLPSTSLDAGRSIMRTVVPTPISNLISARRRSLPRISITSLHIEPPGFSISHRVPRVGFGAEASLFITVVEV
jgi:hypothetical protein